MIRCAAAYSVAAVCILAGCAGHADGPSTGEVEVPLDLTMERVDRWRGRLRISASMEEGAPDVSVWLGRRCETREVGRGYSNGRRLTWTLTADELGRAIACGLSVKARGFRGEERDVRKVAELPVRLSISLADADDAPPRLRKQETREGFTRFLFLDAPAAATLQVGHTIVGREGDDREGGELRPARFVVPNEALAGAVLSRHPLALRGATYDVTVYVRGFRVEEEDEIDGLD